ncbi:helix-turn-helix transcriptional regulator [Sphingobacterium alkalisoli]|uniref:Helix-turn-helix transcriptional regulator n=1 Tax=Sphingobacterium alkalisoli TaxID=1874115 RepID=A0A4U0H373_9SPHI|nr:helix-turn-helix transcriptional regulator [Sphingobacterium alkalisoli]
MYFLRTFNLDTTLSDLREELLLEKAKEYLREGQTATQTAYVLNYSSIYSFSRFFKTQAGMSVSEYVRRLRTGEE